jgi:hypothetical protein
MADFEEGRETYKEMQPQPRWVEDELAEALGRTSSRHQPVKVPSIRGWLWLLGHPILGATP